jgi:hypothetical protein
MDNFRLLMETQIASSALSALWDGYRLSIKLANLTPESFQHKANFLKGWGFVGYFSGMALACCILRYSVLSFKGKLA